MNKEQLFEGVIDRYTSHPFDELELDKGKRLLPELRKVLKNIENFGFMLGNNYSGRTATLRAALIKAKDDIMQAYVKSLTEKH